MLLAKYHWSRISQKKKKIAAFDIYASGGVLLEQDFLEEQEEELPVSQAM